MYILFQQRIQRCVQDCGDNIRDKMPDRDDYSNENEVCKY